MSVTSTVHKSFSAYYINKQLHILDILHITHITQLHILHICIYCVRMFDYIKITVTSFFFLLNTTFYIVLHNTYIHELPRRLHDYTEILLFKEIDASGYDTKISKHRKYLISWWYTIIHTYNDELPVEV